MVVRFEQCFFNPVSVIEQYADVTYPADTTVGTGIGLAGFSRQFRSSG